MRVIAGSLGGRNFASPRGHRTHPMSDKIRGALFNTLGDIAGLTVLDAFAGSGALAIEALSRGASSAVLVDTDRTAQQTIEENMRQLGLRGRSHLIKASVTAWLSTTDDVFDIVLLDPPYDNVSATQLEQLAARARPEGIVVVSLPPKAGVELPASAFRALAHKHYGDADLFFYKRV